MSKGVERLGRWPAVGEPGQFIVRCSCQRWEATGTAAEIGAASRGHDDSPRRNHVVSIYGKIVDVCPKCGTAGCLEDKALDF